MNKALLRKQLLALREALPPETVRENGVAAQERLLAQDLWRRARQVLLYMPLRNELDTTLLVRRAWAEGKSVLLPRVNPQCRGDMCFARCGGEDELVSGGFGLKEPDAERCPALLPDDPAFCPELAVIPGVGFDMTGNRLGFGAGYYDRYLAHPAMSGTVLVGFAHAFQVVPAIPADPWDRPVHALCTEKEFLWL